MSLFDLYPKVSYKISEYDSLKAIDITTSVKVKDFIKTYRGISYIPYVVKDGERPDYVASKIYGDPNLDWAVLLANEIHNIYEEWPKSSAELDEYIISKYGSLSTASSTIKYYYDAKRNIIDATTYDSLSDSERISETAYQYELRININKSKIKLIQPNIVGAIQSEVKSLLYKPVR